MNNPNSIRLHTVAPWILAAGGLLAGLAGTAYGLRNRCETSALSGSFAAAASGKAPIEKSSPFATKPNMLATSKAATKPPVAVAATPASVPTSSSVPPAKEEAAATPPPQQPRIVQFNLPKSKHLQQLGPVRVALRKSDVKRQQYNLNLAMLDGQTVEKKNLNLLEPVYISSAAQPRQPMEFIVNRIEKDMVSGFIRIPNDNRPTPQQQ